jgi:hypothetical protein
LDLLGLLLVSGLVLNLLLVLALIWLIAKSYQSPGHRYFLIWVTFIWIVTLGNEVVSSFIVVFLFFMMYQETINQLLISVDERIKLSKEEK